jgi:hypothetical protein
MAGDLTPGYTSVIVVAEALAHAREDGPPDWLPWLSGGVSRRFGLMDWVVKGRFFRRDKTYRLDGRIFDWFFCFF